MTHESPRRDAVATLEKGYPLLSQPLRVLLVEDNPADARLVRELLAEASPQSTMAQATRLDAALARLSAGEIDVILLDLSLPDARGIEAVIRLNGAAPDMPLVVMSGNDDETLAIAGVQQGAQDYLRKGQVDGDGLLRALRYAIERARQAQALRKQALHDALTGLPNRLLLADRLDQALLIARRERASLALLLLDLDRFKEVNDTHGHHAGDALLVEVGARLRHTLRASDTVARLGGDEFAVLLPGGDRAGAAQAACKIIAALETPIMVEGHALHIGASIGIALVPEHGDDGATLLRRADIAMYMAKRGHDGYSVYDPAQNQYRLERPA